MKTGPYRLARHPIYSGGCLAYIGLLMTHPTVPLAIALTGWAVCIGMRMRYEEAILTQAFPEDYADYRRRVGALVPWPAGEMAVHSPQSSVHGLRGAGLRTED